MLSIANSILSFFKPHLPNMEFDIDEAEPIICDPNANLRSNHFLFIYSSWASMPLEGE